MRQMSLHSQLLLWAGVGLLAGCIAASSSTPSTGGSASNIGRNSQGLGSGSGGGDFDDCRSALIQSSCESFVANYLSQTGPGPSVQAEEAAAVGIELGSTVLQGELYQLIGIRNKVYGP